MIPSYMDRYTIETRLGHPATDEDMARIHNGGPNGYSKMKSIKLSRVSVISVTRKFMFRNHKGDYPMHPL